MTAFDSLIVSMMKRVASQEDDALLHATIYALGLGTELKDLSIVKFTYKNDIELKDGDKLVATIHSGWRGHSESAFFFEPAVTEYKITLEWSKDLESKLLDAAREDVERLLSEKDDER